MVKKAKVEEMRVFKDGMEWCALVGKDIQEGVAGFGMTPEKAIQRLSLELEAGFK